MRDKISVIVPVYNVEKYLSECIESILKQSYTDFELLLIDDGSSDSSGMICEQYASLDNRIIVVHQENAGVSVARNKGLSMATGKYITFIDSDDWVKEAYLSDFFLYLSDFSIQGITLWYSKNDQYIEKIFSESCLVYFSDLSRLIVKAELNSILKGPCAKLFTRSFIIDNLIQFDTNISYGEDHLFILQYIKCCCSMSVVNKTNYIYTHREITSLTNRFLPYDKLSYYTIRAFDFRKELIELFNIKSKEYLIFITNELAFHLLQSLCALYDKRNNVCKQKRLSYIEMLSTVKFHQYIYQSNILPRFYRLMRWILKVRNKSVVDLLLLSIIRFK